MPNVGNPLVTSPRQKDDFRLKDVLRSDKLPTLVNLAHSISALSPTLRDFVQFKIVLDASAAQEHLRWRLGKRTNILATTSIHEAIVSGTVVAFAPTYIETEIFEHEEDIALDTSSTVSAVRAEWLVMRECLHLYPLDAVPEQIKQLVDQDDEPYSVVRKQVGARAIFTRDPHFKKMGEPVVMGQIDIALRDYARATTVKIGVSIGSGVAFAISFEMIAVLTKLLTSAIGWLKRQSPSMQIAILCGILLAAIHPKSRAKCLEVWDSVAHILSDSVASTASRLAIEYAEATNDAKTNLQIIEAAFPLQSKRTLIMHARAVCVMAKEPLTLHELERNIRHDGYNSRSISFRGYLSRVLRGNSEFFEVRPGEWSFNSHTPTTIA